MNRRWKKKKACQKGSGSEHLDETKSVHIATLARGFYFLQELASITYYAPSTKKNQLD